MSVNVDWIKVAHPHIHWWAHVNAVMQHWIPKESAFFLTTRAAISF
jgi:hypothetical protein